MITKADIDANKPVVVKWDKPLTNNGVVTEGVMAGQASELHVLKKNPNYSVC